MNQLARDLLAGHELLPRLHVAEAPGLDALGQPGVPGAVRERDPRAPLPRQRHTLEEQALVALHRQIAQPDVGVGADLGLDLGDVRLDHVEAQLASDRDPVVAVRTKCMSPTR